MVDSKKNYKLDLGVKRFNLILEFRCWKILQLESGATNKYEMYALIKGITFTAFPALDYYWKYLKATPSAACLLNT